MPRPIRKLQGDVNSVGKRRHAWISTKTVLYCRLLLQCWLMKMFPDVMLGSVNISFSGRLGMKVQAIIRAVTLIVGILFSSISYADPVWIDVRSVLENKIDNIEADIRISHSDIVAGVSKLIAA